MKKLIYTAVLILLGLFCIWMILIMAGPAKAVYVPSVKGYDPNKNYMDEMLAAAEDGSPWALAMGQIYEQLRNQKIEGRGMDYATTDFFSRGDQGKVILEKLREYINPAEPEPELDEDEVEMLACVIYQEAGGDAYSDLCRMCVGDVVLNRVADPRFPDTIEGVLLQPSQYGRFSWTGIVWPARAQYAVEAAAVARAYDTARQLLSGDHSELYGAGYIWQAEFPQGTDIIYLDGMYFGR